ncbi:hypothetical protein P2A78_18615 [Xanthomonas perforans]|nr:MULTISPECIES: hypothetical protein [Xanthomonas]MBD1532462.1 hypothetical protein [Xanthomonas citri pv. citri]MBD4081647.1 hypothetical protein [Xanthomonas citri pv. citri]MBD4389202.1 hypothetical protein [Xanthomonas citri pv. citri]MBD4392417.1 hypothetical protein [Xanthomonas citri pv. citri]MBD4400127.1 hypothetical protein [Xanthomonas citri pv. citri]
MKKIILAPMLFILSACGSTSVTNDDLVGRLALSEGHSECISTRLKAALDAARVVEVIPRLHNCTVIERAKSILATSTYQCQSQETSVHFERLYNRTLTDSLDQVGWISDSGPTRIARTVKGDYAVFLPGNAGAKKLPENQCDLFELKVRAGLSTHIAYTAAVKVQVLH